MDIYDGVKGHSVNPDGGEDSWRNINSQAGNRFAAQTGSLLITLLLSLSADWYSENALFPYNRK